MCDSPELLAALAKLTALLDRQSNRRDYIDQGYSVSDTQGFPLDYKGYRYLYVYSGVALSLKIGNTATIAIGANTWTPLQFREGHRIFTTGQATPVNILIRATDDLFAILSSGSSVVSGSVSVSNANPNGQTTMANSSPVVIASDQSAIPITGSITATNPSVGTDGAAIPLSSTLLGASDGTNLQQLLVESSTNRNLRAGIYNGANEWGIDASNKGPVKAAAGDIADLAHGQAAMAASVPVAIANNQGAVPVGITAGTAFDANSGTVGANTQRTVQGSAATGTQTSVASANADTTILASNTSRKGAIIYNDSTQILYLLLASGTSSTTNYSVQVPAQGYFELPGPTIYNGVLKGIWAAANGNARVTEFS